MSVLLIALASCVGFIIAYHTYGRWLGRSIFQLSEKAICPARRWDDGEDYVPTKSSVVFGHHFTSIAGVGPIVGPAIAVFWGWLPALIWVILGSILIGAVHDFGSLVISLRSNGQTIGDIAGRVLSRRTKILFLSILFLALTIVLAIFGLVIAGVFKWFPEAITPCLIQIPIAMVIGIKLHRRGSSLLIPSIIALALMYLSVLYGDVGVLGSFNHWAASWPTIVWSTVLLSYCYIASVLPVWTLLQPRDYINSLQLLSALGLIILGLLAAALLGGPPVEVDGTTIRYPLQLAAPAINDAASSSGAPPLLPFLFITVACGAVSGFHCLVASGTSSKQLEREPDALGIGYGSMLLEGFLAVLVILACCAGLTLTGDAWGTIYSDWSSANGLSAKVGAFVMGAGNFVASLGVPKEIAVALMGVLVASFAGTTLDSSCRLQRYVIEELSAALGGRRADGSPGTPVLHAFTCKHPATLLAVVLGLGLASLPASGQLGDWSFQSAGTGGLILWPMFGATNQLLAGLALMVICFYLWRRGKPILFVALPLLLMLLMPAWAMIDDAVIGSRGSSFLGNGQWLLLGFAFATLALEAWMIVEAALLFPRLRGIREPKAAPPGDRNHDLDLEPSRLP
ncbi:MAG: carbon starvation protein A [Planctomycetes bacterium TMED75]|nr:carbon starvation protein A [Planctomycetaceae bacterium]OUU90431.1 MAG: carbon starvation protein A [Planctomycetes bacterium TMED75]